MKRGSHNDAATPRHATPRHATPRQLFLLLFLIVLLPPAHADIVTGLVGWWKLDGNGNDSSGRGNNGTAISASVATDRFNQSSKAMSFNGTTDYIKVADSSSLRISQAITISAWVKFNTVTGGTNARTIYLKGTQGADNHYWAYWWRPSGVWVFELGNGTTRYYLSYSQIPDLGVWYFFTGTYDVATEYFRLYINGLEKASNHKVGFGTIGGTTLISSIGAYITTGHVFDGSIDDVRIYNRALTQTDITQLYNNGTPGTSLRNATLRGAVLR